MRGHPRPPARSTDPNRPTPRPPARSRGFILDFYKVSNTLGTGAEITIRQLLHYSLDRAEHRTIVRTIVRGILGLYAFISWWHPASNNLLKSFKIRSWVPSPQMPYFKQSTGHTHTTHTTKTKTTQNSKTPKHSHTQDTQEEEPHLPGDLKRYRRGLVSSELLSETEIIFLLETKGQQPATSFRAACGQGGRAARGARAAGSKGRRRRLSHLEQLADQRPAQLQQRVADLVVHLAQRQLKNLR